MNREPKFFYTLLAKKMSEGGGGGGGDSDFTIADVTIEFIMSDTVDVQMPIIYEEPGDNAFIPGYANIVETTTFKVPIYKDYTTIAYLKLSAGSFNTIQSDDINVLWDSVLHSYVANITGSGTIQVTFQK